MAKRSKAILLLLSTLLLLLAAGCGGKKAAPVDLQGVWDTIQTSVQLPGMRPLSEKRMMDRYGMDASALPQALVMVREDSLRVDEVWLVEAADDAAAKELAASAEGYIRQICKEQKDYSPEQYAVAERGRVVVKGPYVGLFLSPDSDRMAEIFEDALR